MFGAVRDWLMVWITQPDAAPFADLLDYGVQLRTHLGKVIFHMRRDRADLDAPDQAFLFQHLEPTAQGAGVYTTQRFLKFTKTARFTVHQFIDNLQCPFLTNNPRRNLNGTERVYRVEWLPSKIIIPMHSLIP